MRIEPYVIKRTLQCPFIMLLIDLVREKRVISENNYYSIVFGMKLDNYNEPGDVGSIVFVVVYPGHRLLPGYSFPGADFLAGLLIL